MLHDIRAAVAVRVLIDRNAILPLRAFRRRIGNLVVFRAQPVVHLDRFQTFGIRVLPILQHPHPAPIIEADRQRLTDLRLGDDQTDRQPLRHLEPFR